MLDLQQTTPRAESHAEGRVARAIENQTARLPSDMFLWAAGGSMGLSLGLLAAGRRHLSLFVGQWAAPLLIVGLYNKLVKVAGSDRLYRDYPRDDFDHEASAETVVEPGEPVTMSQPSAVVQGSQPHFGTAEHEPQPSVYPLHGAADDPTNLDRASLDRPTLDRAEARAEDDYRRHADAEFGTAGFGLQNVSDYPHDERFPAKPSEEPLPPNRMP